MRRGIQTPSLSGEISRPCQNRLASRASRSKTRNLLSPQHMGLATVWPRTGQLATPSQKPLCDTPLTTSSFRIVPTEQQHGEPKHPIVWKRTRAGTSSEVAVPGPPPPFHACVQPKHSRSVESGLARASSLQVAESVLTGEICFHFSRQRSLGYLRGEFDSARGLMSRSIEQAKLT